MPSVQDFLAGNAAFADINEADWKAYVAEQQKAQQDLLTKDRHASSAMSALRVRPVVAQASQNARANTASVYPTRPQPPPSFASTDSSAKNKIRFVFADDPFSEVSHFGQNSVIPDATHYHLIGNEIDRLMVTTRKFTEISEFWTPTHGKYFDGLVFILQCMRAAATTGAISTEIRDVLDLFEGPSAVYPLSSIPVCGPLENTLSCVSSSYGHLLDFDPIRVFVPATPDATSANRFVLNNNACMRFPPIPFFLNQLSHIHNHADLSVAGDLGEAIWRNHFLNPTYDVELRTTAAGANAPTNATSYNQRYVLRAAATDTVKRQVNSPGVLPTFFGTPNFTQFNNYRASVPVPVYDAPNNLPAANLTWTQFLGLHEPEFFEACLRIANIRAKFFKGSCSLADIQPAGHTGLQPIADVVTKGTAVSRIANRFNNVDWTFTSSVRNPLAPAADLIDSASAPVNISHLPAGANGHNASGAPNASGSSASMATARIGGPYFANTSVVKRATSKRPNLAYGTTVTAHYYSPVPLRD